MLDETRPPSGSPLPATPAPQASDSQPPLPPGSDDVVDLRDAAAPAAHPAPPAPTWPPASRRADEPTAATGLAPVPARPARRVGRRAGVAAAVVVVALAGVGFAGYRLSQSAPLTNLSGEVVSNGQVSLGFPYSGILSSVLVHAGERVAKGQVLATEVVPGSAEQLAADRTALAADEAQVAGLRSLLAQVQAALQRETAGQAQVASAEVQAAVTAIAAAGASQSNAIASLEGQVRAAQALLQTDQASYRAQCPAAPSGASQPASATEQQCAALAHDVAADELAVSTAEASTASQETVQAEWLALANRDRSDAVAAAAGSLGPSIVTTASLESDLLRAEQQLPAARAQLAIDESKVGATKLVAPEGGSVVSVAGVAGELVSVTGVGTPAASGGSVAVSPGFQLFPSRQTQAGSGSSSSPVAVLATHGSLLVNVVVPESQIGLVRVGAPATVHPGVAGLRPERGVVVEIFPQSIVAAGVVSYEVQLRLERARGAARYLPGMTVTASIGH